MAATLMELESVGSVEAFLASRAIFIRFLTRKCGYSLMGRSLMLVKGRMLSKYLATASDFATIFLSVFMKCEVAFQALCCCKALVTVLPIAEMFFLLYMGGGNMTL